MNVSELPEKLKEIQPHYLWWQGGHGNLMQYGTKETFSKFASELIEIWRIVSVLLRVKCGS